MDTRADDEQSRFASTWADDEQSHFASTRADEQSCFASTRADDEQSHFASTWADEQSRCTIRCDDEVFSFRNQGIGADQCALSF